jgi:hypothetical protein
MSNRINHVPRSDVKTLPVTAESIFWTSDTPPSSPAVLSEAMAEDVVVDERKEEAVYLESVRGVSQKSQNLENDGGRIVFRQTRA